METGLAFAPDQFDRVLRGGRVALEILLEFTNFAGDAIYRKGSLDENRVVRTTFRPQVLRGQTSVPELDMYSRIYRRPGPIEGVVSLYCCKLCCKLYDMNRV